MTPPTNLEIDDANLVASLGHSFEEMVGLVGPPFNPIRLLEDENPQRISTLNAWTGIEGEGDADLEICGLLNPAPVLLEPTMDLPQAVLEFRLRLVVENTPGLLNGGEEPVLLVPVSSFFEYDAR